MRACGVVQAPWQLPATTPTDEPAPRTLLSWPAQSPGRRHRCRRRWAFTPPFHPVPRTWVGLLSVAVLRHGCVSTPMPPLAVSRGGLPAGLLPGEESGSSSESLQRRLVTSTFKHYNAIYAVSQPRTARGRPRQECYTSEHFLFSQNTGQQSIVAGVLCWSMLFFQQDYT
jgi:hypothetical protein